jgi:thiosulfate dehydrogenase
MQPNKETNMLLVKLVQQSLLIIATVFSTIISLIAIFLYNYNSPIKDKNFIVKNTYSNSNLTINNQPQANYWQAAAIEAITDEKLRQQVAYGKELIVNTDKYFGVQGLINQSTNGMNCQNCHLEAGTKIYGNNYGAVAVSYPKFRARSNSVESIPKRLNDCFERSMNGKALDTNSREIRALEAYLQYIGKNTPKDLSVKGLVMKDLAFLDRPANVEKGKQVYVAKCQSCHQTNGEGVWREDKKGFLYPPVWGKHSYNDAAGMFRVINLAKFVKYNMPLGATHDSPLLTDEEAWDVAAFINSQPRPHKPTPNDWKDIRQKPIDYPFPPFADTFPAEQHKYGSFKPMLVKK